MWYLQYLLKLSLMYLWSDSYLHTHVNRKYHHLPCKIDTAYLFHHRLLSTKINIPTFPFNSIDLISIVIATKYNGSDNHEIARCVYSNFTSFWIISDEFMS